MGKTKTAFVGMEPESAVSGEAKYKKRLEKKLKEEAAKKAAVGHVGLKGGERIKVVGGLEPAITEVPEKLIEDAVKKTADSTEKKTEKKIRTRGKKYNQARAKIDKNKAYKLSDAVKLVKSLSTTTFDGTVELHILIGKAGFSENITLPHPFGKTKKIEVADEKTVEKLKSGKVDFDVLLATPEMMPKLVPFAKLLGPRGLMPNPKNGTIIKSAKDANKFLAAAITIKTEREHPVIHTVCGKVSQTDKQIEENTELIINIIGKKQITRAYIASTMSPSIRLEI